MANCSQNLNSITVGCDNNKGGLFTLWLFPYYKEDGITKTFTLTKDADTEEIKGITLDGVTLIPFQFRKQSSSATSTYTLDDANGVSYVTTELALRFARQDAAKRLAINSLLKSQVAGIYKDNNGKYVFIGEEEPVTATAGTSESGTAFTDANQYTLTLSDTTLAFPSFVTDGAMEELLG